MKAVYSARTACAWCFVGCVPAIVMLAVLSATQVRGQDVVVEDESVADAPPANTVPWEPEVVQPREENGAAYFQRQSSDAFVDPDQRMNLVPKYYFVLPASVWPAKDARFLGDMRRGPDVSMEVINRTGALGGPRRPAVQWLDYEAGDKAHLLAVLTIPEPEVGNKGAAQLAIRSVKRIKDAWEIGPEADTRDIPPLELPSEVPGGLMLDTYDRPAELASRKALVGRVVAVLKRINDRDAVDFYGEKLNAEADCRLWLAPEGHPLGDPTGIRFVRITVKRDTGKLAQVDVLAVQYVDEQDRVHLIAFDFPMCATAALAQMRSLSDALASRKGSEPKPGAQDQATALLGEDLADELARRLVNGLYK